jgi:hypothetical protein
LERKNQKLKEELEQLTKKYKFLVSKRKNSEGITLSDDEEESAISLLKECLEIYGDSWKQSFHYTLVTDQLKAIVTDPRGMRWNPAVLDFFTSISYYGGKKVYNLLRGSGYEGQNSNGKKGGKLTKECKNFNLFIPAMSTLRRNLPKVDPYSSKRHIPFKAQNLEKMFKNLKDWEDLPFTGGLVYDEIEIRKGLIYLKRSNIIVGLAKGPLDIRTLHSSNTDFSKAIAKKVCQCFFVSNCGRICMPIHFFPTTSVTATELTQQNKLLVEELSKVNINIAWTSTDGFKGSAQFDQKTPNSIHIFDYVHMVKLGRNQLLNRMIRVKHTDGNYVHFSMKDLLLYWMDSPLLQKHFTLDDLHPSDKQDILPVKRLLERTHIIRQFAATQSGIIKAKCLCLSLYLEKLEELYQIFSDNTQTLQSKLGRIATLKSYFEEWKKEDNPEYNFITIDLFTQITTSLRGFSKLIENKESSVNLKFSSILGTNIVENYFSIIRGKIMYPNLWEYACVCNRAFMELVKRFQVDRQCSVPSRPLSKSAKLKYNDQSGISFTKEDHATLFQIPSEIPTENVGQIVSEEQKQWAMELCEVYKPTRKRLTIRQKTCKQEEGELIRFQRKGDTDLGAIYPCFDSSCAKSFQTAGAYRNHLKLDHDITFEGNKDELFYYKGPENYVHLQKTVPEKMVSDEIVEYRVDKTPATIDDERKSEEDNMDREDGRENEVVAIVFWDVETTGKKKGSTEDHIVEIGCSAWVKGDDKEYRFQKLINPRQHIHVNPVGLITSAAYRVHGIGISQVSKSPKWNEVYPIWEAYLSALRSNGRGKILMLAHNSKTADLNALQWDCHSYGIELPSYLMYVWNFKI